MKYFLFNSLADNGSGKKNAEKARINDEEYIFKNLTELPDQQLTDIIADKNEIVIAGGDGTLNRFVNFLGGQLPQKNIYYYPTGCGNDFMKDIEKEVHSLPVLLNRYIENLPLVKVKGREHRFINGIGYGIDGYCCEIADRIKAKSSKPINYTAIALKGLLYDFKPVTARVCVDGKEKVYENVWLAPTMNGRYYGGGMMIAPRQARLNKEGTLTTVVVSSKSRLKLLLAFPLIFKGGHAERKDIAQMYTGREVHVEFDRPTALQIDGETVTGVTEYTVTHNNHIEADSKENAEEVVFVE